MNNVYRLVALFAVCIMLFNIVEGQTTVTGKPIGEIYADFHAKLNEYDTISTTGFDINRAFLGYNFTLDNNFSTKVIVNGAGNPNDAGVGAARRRYAHLREASLAWSNEQLTLTFGLTETRIFGPQQRWWGKRYLAADVQSLHGFGFVSDLGVVIDYKFNDIFSGDITVMNGEGFYELQLDNNVKSSLGLTINPNQNFMFRVYGDHYRVPGLNQFTGVVFAGYKNKYFYVGADYSYKSNVNGMSGHNTWAISTLNGVYITEKDELFFRYDYAKSVRPGPKLCTDTGECTQRWDLRDGTFMIIGLQHTFSPNVKLTLNYQGTNPYFDELESRRLLYVNAHFRF